MLCDFLFPTDFYWWHFYPIHIYIYIYIGETERQNLNISRFFRKESKSKKEQQQNGFNESCLVDRNGIHNVKSIVALWLQLKWLLLAFASNINNGSSRQ